MDNRYNEKFSFSSSDARYVSGKLAKSVSGKIDVGRSRENGEYVVFVNGSPKHSCGKSLGGVPGSFCRQSNLGSSSHTKEKLEGVLKEVERAGRVGEHPGRQERMEKFCEEMEYNRKSTGAELARFGNAGEHRMVIVPSNYVGDMKGIGR